ncbi:type II toxin-antitoxin system HicB family antitoxin [Acidisarcina polymorpha]|uniref:type II toxin-antitoxin system HicB family antitoxin n=1 Tax=Acidisarcina polymorpha TaxID=2211140 RepID=UPI000DEFC282|nr:type II toxin-antitoxin system HicB family antitoxin [Acidisarcina polymorpha]
MEEFEITFDREEDGRWIAEIEALPGVMAYGSTQAEAESKVKAIALRVVAAQIEEGRALTSEVHFSHA